ncbi:hypothetical protein J6590_032141 [Homalodisca vitripennis]|nr:hypothetical protein J6590_032141 [Homalodisca vitripennis]
MPDLSDSVSVPNLTLPRASPELVGNEKSPHKCLKFKDNRINLRLQIRGSAVSSEN